MENQSFKIPKEELQQIEELLKKEGITEGMPLPKVQLVILYKLGQIQQQIKNIEKRWMTPLIP